MSSSKMSHKSERDATVDIDNITFSKSGSKYYSPITKDIELISQLDLTNISSAKGSSSKSRSSKSRSSKSRSSKSRSSDKEDEEEQEDSDENIFECELFIKIITEVFERSEIVDASIYGLYTEINTDMDTPIAVVNIGNITNDKDMTCAIIEYVLDEKKIYIQQIARCSDSEISSTDKRGEQGSGLHIISKMKQVYFEFKEELGKDIKLVIESDEAVILIPIGEKRKTFNISLSWLTLFSTGQSWYNKQGFKEANFDLNTEAVNEFILQPIVSVITSEPCIQDMIAYGLIKDNEDDSKTVKSIFTVVLKRLKIISFNANNSKSEYASDDDIVELKAYAELLNRTMDKFSQEAPRGFYMKFKNLSFIDSGVGLGKKRRNKKRSKKGKKGKKGKTLKKNNKF